ncbi:MAG: hypothetical protein ACLP5H_06925 [Desulfomonilaceae bacterium]
MNLNEDDKVPEENAQDNGTRFSTTCCLTPDQETMIAQRTVSVLKGKDKVPGEMGENGKAKKIIFSKPVRDEVNPLLKKGAELEVGGFNSIHETIHERGNFVVNEVDPVLSKWNISFRWYCKMVSDISGIQSRGSWNNHRIIFKGFGEKLKTDPDVRKLSERKLLICAKHDNPVEFVNSNIDRIQKSPETQLQESVTGKKPEKKPPTPDRHYRSLDVRTYWSEAKEELRLTGVTPEVRAAIYELLDNRESEAQEMDNALSTLLEDGSFDWTPYWTDMVKNAEITVNYTTTDGQHCFWAPDKGRVPYGTWAEVVEAIRVESPDAYVMVAEGPEHKIAETSFATDVPQTYVTLPKELVDQLIQKQEGVEQTGSAEEPDQTITNVESSDRAEVQDNAPSTEDEIPVGHNGEGKDESATERNSVECGEEENGWTPGEGWTEHEGSLDLTGVFGNVQKDERWVDVHVSFSGNMDDEKSADPRYEEEIPLTSADLIQYLESEEFARYRGAKLIWFTNEEGKPYLYATYRHGWKVWSNVSAIPLSN